MKKLLIAAFVAVLGIAANAAAVSWSMTSIDNSPDVPKAGNWVAYVLDASTYDAFSALEGDKVAAYAVANALYSGATVNSRGAVSVTIKDGNFSAGETINSYMVLFNNAAADKATYFAYTATGSTTISAGGADDSIAFGTFANATSTTGGWQTTAVPEPTSGLLMLIGMAGLALRRRRA